MAGFVGELKAASDYILVDTPPVLAVTDALVLGPLVDGLIPDRLGREDVARGVEAGGRKAQADRGPKRPASSSTRLDVAAHDYYYRHHYYYDCTTSIPGSMIDLHAHITCPVGTTGPRWAETRKMCGIAREDGIEKIIATPHVFRLNKQGNDWPGLEAGSPGWPGERRVGDRPSAGEPRCSSITTWAGR